MSIVDCFLPWLEKVHQAGLNPRIKAIHLPRLETADDRRGEFCAVELDDGSMGLSYALLDGTLHKLHAADLEGRMAGRDAIEWLRDSSADDLVAATLGFATVNAITRHVFDRAGFKPAASGDSFGGLAPGGGDHVGMVGFFSPIVPRIVATGAALTVLELKPEYAGDFDGYRVTLNREDLAVCNKIICTSTVLLNNTLQSVMSQCTGAERFVLLGPGASCLPDPLFRMGVMALAGAWISDPVAVIDALNSGESWSRHAYKFVLAQNDYPGLDQLLANCQAG